MLKQLGGNTERSVVRAWITTVAAFAAILLLAPDALADSSNSANWAGYAVHRTGVSFRRVSATWHQPTASCTTGQPAYSAYWVGLGGYSQTSDALEQIGTETDCDPSGNPVLSAWYELVPAPSRPIKLTVQPGDAISASVTMNGHQATLSLTDLTRHHSFSKTMHASSIDISSAEWIVEAPSDCITISSCQTLPLANFGTAAFNSAQAEGIKRHTGSISSWRWNSTKITLTPGGRRYTGYSRGSGITAGEASPSDLTAAGTAFTVRYSQVFAPGNPFMTPRATTPALVPAGHLYH
jgi:Peptidase A4 family